MGKDRDSAEGSKVDKGPWANTAKLLLLFAFLLAFAALATPASALPTEPLQPPPLAPPIPPKTQPQAEPEQDTRIPGHYIVVFKDSVAHPGNLAEAQTEQKDGDLGFIYRHALKGYSAELSKDAVEALRENPQVKYVTPAQWIELEAQTLPTGIKRVGATENATADIDGKDDARVNVDVAVIDSGVDYIHPDLNVYKRTNCVPSGEDPEKEGNIKSCTDNSGTDGVGHGTHVAGTIGAIDNGDGVAGVAAGARLWAARVFNNKGKGTMPWAIAAVDWVTTHASEIEVANMSLGGAYNPALEEAVTNSVEAGVVYAVAAGNSSVKASNFSPANNPDAITVSALADYDGKLGGQAQPLLNSGPGKCETLEEYNNYGDDDRMAWFSNFGSVVDIAAPGVCIFSTVPGGGYDYNSGTSMASPHVAGAAALLASKSNPNSKEDVEAIRQQIADEGNRSWVSIYSWYGHEWNQTPSTPLLDVSPLGAATYTTTASEVVPTEAKLNGGANPYAANTSYRFEYGTTTSYGASIPSSPKNIGSGSKDVGLSETVKGLKPFTTYHYRLTTINEATKVETHGEDRTLFTPGSVSTMPATSIGTHRARLSATINPWGVETSYHFEYGTSTTYGQSTPVSPKSIGSGTVPVKISEPIEGLRGGTKYHYRVVATTSEGEVKHGKDETFFAADSEFVANWTELGHGHPFKLKGEIAKTSDYDEFALYDAGAHGAGYQFFCDSFSFTSNLLFANAESFRVAIEDPHCFKGGGTNTIAMNGCELEFYLEGGVDIVGSECTAITVDTSDGCTVEIGPQRGLNIFPDGPDGFGEGGFGIQSGLGVNYTTFTVKHRFFTCPAHEGTWETGVLEGNWEVWGVRGEDGVNEIEARIFSRPAVTGTAVGVGQTSVTPIGTVHAHGAESDYRFQYGLTSAYGSQTQWKTLPGGEEIGGDEKTDEVSNALEDLKPNTTYHYRLQVINDYGTFSGDDETVTTLPLCKGAEGKCEWKAQSTPDLSKSEHSLTGVSCASANMCFGVGTDSLTEKGFAELWDGTQWSNELGFGKSASGVSCPSATWCVAVGVAAGASFPQAWLLKKEGSNWSFESPFTLPKPSGGSKLTLRSVSCSSTTACTAVGSYYVESEGKYKPLVERWNGTSWSLESAPNPPSGSAEKAMLAVSCASATSCTAVGTANNVPFVESWNGTSWSVQSIPVPSPSVESTLEGVSCTSAGACTAVGSYKETSSWTKYKKPLAEHWNGSTWSIQATPSPGEAKGMVKLVGVSCTSSSACTAVGRYAPVTGENPNEQRTLAESWNGTSWTVQSSPNSAQKVNGLAAVSCSAVSACTAVGSAQAESSDLSNADQASLAERWNGSEWKVQATPGQSRSSYSLADVSCASASICLAVGNDPYTSRGFAELWDGSQWTMQFGFGKSGADIACPATNWCMAVGVAAGASFPQAWLLKKEGSNWSFESPFTLPKPSGGSKLTLRSVSCSSTTACTAVGSYYVESEGKYKPLVERWNGTSWSLESAPNPPSGSAEKAMLAVSCASATSCTAVGTANNVPFVESWNGTSWSVQSIPVPSPSVESTLEGVSCTSAGACTAVGSYKETLFGNFKPLAMRWNGSGWTILAPSSPANVKDVTLKGISCVATYQCTAVGNYRLQGGERKTLVEDWNGASWTIQDSPDSSQKVDAFTGVSCSSAIVCTAVGAAEPEEGSTVNETSLAARYE